MEMLRLSVFLALLGLVAAQDANETKRGAVDKVITLLEDLQSTVMEEGEKEAATYNKFACFCKDTTAEKSQAISDGEDSKNTITGEINSLSSRRDELDGMIETWTGDIEDAEKDIKTAQTLREKELKQYQADEADLSGAISALEGAIKALKDSKPTSLMQLQGISKTVKEAVLMADALGLGGKKVDRVMALLQNGEVPTENYKFHSNDIIDTLEGLLVDFKDQKKTVDEDEVEAVKDHNLLVQEKENFIDNKTKYVNDARKEKADKQEEIATYSQDLSTVAAELLDNQQYLTKLADMCSDKAKTWDSRSKVRADELAAITQAITIVEGTVKEKTSAATIRFAQAGMTVKLAEAMVKDKDAMDSVEAEAEAADAAPSFMQKKALRSGAFLAAARRVQGPDGSQVVMDMLLNKGKQLHSAMLSSLASEIGSTSGEGKDKFAKIKMLISELIERLLKESAAEANQKGWCDKSLSDATQKRDYAAEEIMTLNANLAKLEATRDELAQDLTVLADEIQDLKDKRKDAEKMRGEEKTENEATVKEANEGLSAVKQAIEVLEQFYGTAKNTEVDLSLAQKQPEIDAPDAGFEAGEAYKGASGKAGGVIGMLEVIEGDFTRTVVETEKAEAKAEQDHLEFMTETGKSLAEKEKAEEEKTRQKDDAEEKITTDSDNMKSQNDLLKGAVKELIQLHKTCIDTGMSYEERVARREDEIEALHKALCIFENFETYGPDAATGGVC